MFVVYDFDRSNACSDAQRNTRIGGQFTSTTREEDGKVPESWHDVLRYAADREPVSIPTAIDIPEDTWGLDLYARHTGSGCDALDDKGGARFHFEVRGR